VRPSSDRSLKGQPELEPGLLQQERVQALELGLQRALERGPVLERALEPRAQRVPQLREL
tara:strand:+ start:424 stop:603 length:180 start_codon:yes stop_codon:yes gene_type:complete